MVISRALHFLNDQDKYTLSLGLQVFQQYHGAAWGLLREKTKEDHLDDQP
jgi:hypothetical protein